MSHQLTLILYFGRDLVDLNVLHRSNVALKTPDEVGCWIIYCTTLNSLPGHDTWRGVGVLLGSVVI